jgi:hypothetical protein
MIHSIDIVIVCFCQRVLFGFASSFSFIINTVQVFLVNVEKRGIKGI